MGGSSTCQDHPDSATFQDVARSVMPDIDAVTMATPPADVPQTVMFSVPASWPDGEYVAYVEVNTEGDYNDIFNADVYKTPMSNDWDSWAMSYGYPYRGQPSVVYGVPFTLDQEQRAVFGDDAGRLRISRRHRRQSGRDARDGRYDHRRSDRRAGQRRGLAPPRADVDLAAGGRGSPLSGQPAAGRSDRGHG